MNVAIIGAGLAGLACAYELERNGIFPQILKKPASLEKTPSFRQSS
jgi:FAD binding domain.